MHEFVASRIFLPTSGVFYKISSENEQMEEAQVRPWCVVTDIVENYISTELLHKIKVSWGTRRHYRPA